MRSYFSYPSYLRYNLYDAFLVPSKQIQILVYFRPAINHLEIIFFQTNVHRRGKILIQDAFWLARSRGNGA
jgi:hypothetical protein